MTPLITRPGQYRSREGKIVIIHSVGRAMATGAYFFGDDIEDWGEIGSWHLTGHKVHPNEPRAFDVVEFVSPEVPS